MHDARLVIGTTAIEGREQCDADVHGENTRVEHKATRDTATEI